MRKKISNKVQIHFIFTFKKKKSFFMSDLFLEILKNNIVFIFTIYFRNVF
jgi:hypothetical protein